MAGTAIPRATGTAIGNMTGGGGIASAFTNTTNAAPTAGPIGPASAPGYVGKNYSPALVIAQVIAWSCDGTGTVHWNRDSNSDTITLNLYAKHTSPANATDGTLLGTVSFTNGSVETRTVISSDGTTAWEYVWLEITSSAVGSSSDGLVYSSLQFYQFQVLTAAQGGFSLTGFASLGTKTKLLLAAVGSFALTGIAAALSSARHLVPAQGAFALTGKAATLGKGFKALVSAQGAFALTGIAAALNAARKVVAAQGGFTLTGKAITIGRGIHMAASAGSFVLTGIAASLKKALHLAAAQGSFIVTGINLIEAVLVAPANKFRIRVAKAVLYTIRGAPPTLDQ